MRGFHPVAYVLHAEDGVEIHLADGHVLTIGSPDPHGLARALPGPVDDTGPTVAPATDMAGDDPGGPSASR